MLSVCAGLVTIDDGSSIIRLVHYTAQEYFQQTLKSWVPNAYSDVAKVCLEYLLYDVLAVGACETHDALKERLREDDKVLLSYPMLLHTSLFTIDILRTHV